MRPKLKPPPPWQEAAAAGEDSRRNLAYRNAHLPSTWRALGDIVDHNILPKVAAARERDRKARIRLPDLREEIAQCGRARQMHDACKVHYVGLR